MTEPTDHGFFVGYFNGVPRAIALFTVAAGAAVVGAAAACAFLLAAATDDPVARVYEPDTVVRGGYVALPYPHLRMPAGAGHPTGRTLLLGGRWQAWGAISRRCVRGTKC